MPLVNVLINARAYTVACDEGEEDHLRELAQFLDQRVAELVSTVGQVGDERLLVMAGLVICDELSDALARVNELEKKSATQQQNTNGAAEKEKILAETLEKAAERIEAIAARIASA